MKKREAVVIETLKKIAEAQWGFPSTARRDPPEYGTLKDLVDAKLLPASLASGKKEGYVFETGPSTKRPTVTFWVTASSESGSGRFFFADKDGNVFAGTAKPDAFGKEFCHPPAGWTKLK